MTDKEVARVKVAMDIIRENCESSADCERCPFDLVCDAYRHYTCQIPREWKSERYGE